jgi:hypothetical protein
MLWSGQAAGGSPCRDLCSRVHTKLPHDVRDVTFDGALANDELLGDSPITSAERDQRGDISFTRGEATERQLVGLTRSRRTWRRDHVGGMPLQVLGDRSITDSGYQFFHFATAESESDCRISRSTQGATYTTSRGVQQPQPLTAPDIRRFRRPRRCACSSTERVRRIPASR